MARKLMLLVALASSATGVIAASPASAQSFGVYVGSGYPAPGYYEPRYYDPYAYDYQRRAAWAEHERWQARQRWEREEARRRYWEQRRHEHRWHGHHDDDGDD
jgi:hypothetical protein